MTETLFPRCIREGKKVDVSVWSLADAVLAETDGKLNGKRGLQAVCNDFQKLCGLDYSAHWLGQLRLVAQQFPKTRRYDGEHNKPIVSVKAHMEAVRPDNLDGIVKAAKKEGVAVTSKFVQHMIAFFRAEEHRGRKQEYEAAVRDREQAAEQEAAAISRQKNAKSAHDREQAKREREQAAEEKKAAQQRVKQTKPMPRAEFVAPKDESVLRLSVLVANLKVKAFEAKGLARGARKELGDRISELSDTQTAVLHELAMEVAETWRELAKDIQGASGKKSHLSVVA